MEGHPRKPPSPLALPVIAPGVWREVGRLHCLRLECGVGILLWQEGSEWHYRTSGMGLADEQLRVAPDPDVRHARESALRWLVLAASVVVDQASSVLLETRTH